MLGGGTGVCASVARRREAEQRLAQSSSRPCDCSSSTFWSSRRRAWISPTLPLPRGDLLRSHLARSLRSAGLSWTSTNLPLWRGGFLVASDGPDCRWPPLLLRVQFPNVRYPPGIERRVILNPHCPPLHGRDGQSHCQWGPDGGGVQPLLQPGDLCDGLSQPQGEAVQLLGH